MEPWENPERYKGDLTVRCNGCGEPCAKTSWGKWCYECNVVRMRRINARLAPVRKALGMDN